MAAMVNMTSLLNGKDSRWLQLEVCREFQRNKCSRQDTECKFAHPPANVEVQNGKVTACYDSIKVSPHKQVIIIIYININIYFSKYSNLWPFVKVFYRSTLNETLFEIETSVFDKYIFVSSMTLSWKHFLLNTAANTLHWTVHFWQMKQVGV